MDRIKKHQKKVGWTIGVGGVISTLYSLNPDLFIKFLNDTYSSTVTQFGFCFLLASWVHAREVRIEIRTQIGGLVEAINQVKETLSADLHLQAERLEKVEGRLSALETKTKGEST